MKDDDHATGQTLGSRLLEPKSLWDRALRYGLFCWAVIGILGFVYVVFRYGLYPIRVVFTPIAVAVIVVYVLNPLVTRLGTRMRRGAAVAVVYVAFLVIVGAVAVKAVPLIGRQIAGLLNALPDLLATVARRVNQFAESRGVSKPIRSTPDDFIQFVKDNRSTLTGILGGVRSVAVSVVHVVVNLVIGIVLSVYVLLDLPSIKERMRAAVPEQHRDGAAAMAGEIGESLGGYFRGQLLVALFVGVASAAALAAVKIPYAVLVGMIAGIFNLVPLIGPFVGAVPAVFLGLLSGEPIRALWAVLVLLGVQQIDNHLVSPNVMGRTVKLHPITVMVSLLVAGTVAGILGMLVVIPLVASLKIVIGRAWRYAERRPDVVPEMIGASVEAVIEAAGETEQPARRSTKRRRPSRGSPAGGSRTRSAGGPRAPQARRRKQSRRS